jgi:hypothetical protein
MNKLNFGGVGSKVFSFGVGEDSKFFGEVFSSVEEYFNEVGKDFSSVFLDEFDCVVVRDGVEDYDGGIDLDGMMESLNWDNGGKSEFKKLKKFVREVESEIEGSSVVVLSYYVGVDNSWVVLEKNDYDRLLVLCGEDVEMI